MEGIALRLASVDGQTARRCSSGSASPSVVGLFGLHNGVRQGRLQTRKEKVSDCLPPGTEIWGTDQLEEEPPFSLRIRSP